MNGSEAMELAETQEIEEVMDKAEELTKKALPEAPVSITVKGYFKGFSVLITKRSDSGDIKLDKIMEAVNNMVEKGFKPSWNTETNGKAVKQEPKAVCDACGGEAVEKSGETNNKKWKGVFCQNPECKKVKWLKA